MTQGEATRLESFEALLDKFGQLPGRVERPRTFMEIAGYPHYENVCSNILAFFMDPEESHGLGTLVLDALASAANIDDADLGVGGNVSVEREVHTDAGNRIDILITSYDHAILIENKIYAAANNPFGDYAAYLDRTANGRNKCKILLTLDPINAGDKWGFMNLTHEELVGQIRSLLRRYASSADDRHLTMFMDFLNTLENLRMGTRMNKEFVKFLAKRSDEIEDLHTDLESFKRELNEKAQGLKNLVQAKDSHPGVFGEGAGPKATLAFHLHHIIDVTEDFQAHISTIISPHGWEIEFFVLKRGDYLRLRELLQHLEIPFEERKTRLIHPAHFDYDEDLGQIGPLVQELVDKLATSQEREVKS